VPKLDSTWAAPLRERARQKGWRYYVRNVEVVGSSPITSTSQPASKKSSPGANNLRGRQEHIAAAGRWSGQSLVLVVGAARLVRWRADMGATQRWTTRGRPGFRRPETGPRQRTWYRVPHRTSGHLVEPGHRRRVHWRSRLRASRRSVSSPGVWSASRGWLATGVGTWPAVGARSVVPHRLSTHLGVAPHHPVRRHHRPSSDFQRGVTA
jgi:hypothetical protein